jgi:hypothetical protein
VLRAPPAGARRNVLVGCVLHGTSLESRALRSNVDSPPEPVRVTPEAGADSRTLPARPVS